MRIDDAILVERLFGTLRGFYRLLASGSDGAHLVELPGVQACVVPATPERSYPNAVVYENPHALAAALDELAAAYAGVHAWTVWVPEADRPAAELLAGAGHRLDGRPTAMGCALDGVERPANGMRWSRGVDLRVLAEMNDHSFGFGTNSFARAFAGLDPARFHVYAAEVDGRPASVLMTSDHDGNCGVDAVATLPRARRRGLAGDLLRHALVDARERGCETSTLIATPMGRPVYERIGYRPLGIVEMWERRRA